MTVAEEFATFLTSTTYEQLPETIIRRAKLSLLDALGSMAFSQRLSHAARVVNVLSSESGQYTVVGTAKRASLTDAVFLNGMLQVAYELTGGSWSIPAALLGTAELVGHEHKESVKGHDLITAFAVANEIQSRLHEWVGFNVERWVGWHLPAFNGCIGSAAAAARLLGLDVEQAINALSISADMAGGGLIHSRNNSKRFHLGRAPQGGVLAALIAREGIIAGKNIFEDPRWGYFRVLRYGTEPMNDLDTIDAATVTDNLGTRFESDKPLSTKYYPFHSTAQTIIDNVKNLKAAENVAPDDVVTVVIHLTPFLHDHDQMLLPAREIGHANFSFPYAAAMALKYSPKRLTEEGGTGDIFVEALNDPDVKAMQDKVTFVRSQLLDKENPYTMNTIVEFKLRDGRTVQTRTSYGATENYGIRGSSRALRFDSVSDKDFVMKFRNSVKGVLTREAADALIGAVDALDSNEGIDQIFSLIQEVGEGPSLLT